MIYAGALYPGLYFPSVGRAVLPEYHDFISQVVRESVGDVMLCREATGTVRVTRSVAIATSINREVTITSRVLADELFTMEVER